MVERIEKYAFAVIFHGLCLNLSLRGDKIFLVENRCHLVQYKIAVFLYVIGYQVLKW